MGFEPTISTVTGWRALRTAPREVFSRASDNGLESGSRSRDVIVHRAGDFHSFNPSCDAKEKARVGVEPTASLVLSQSGLPIAYRAMFPLMPKAGVEPADARV